MTNRHTAARTLAAFALLFALPFALPACGGDAGKDGRQQAAATPNATTNAAPEKGSAPADPAQLEAEIARLERQAERNPTDESMQKELAVAYVRRGDSHRAADRTRDALRDYQRALRADPDNEAAQRAAAEVSPLVEGGEKTGENGEPAPLPITPNVADEEEKPTPTPKKP
jgi:cytochrome c-type biogenesis protein CcmH/NrfG